MTESSEAIFLTGASGLIGQLLLEKWQNRHGRIFLLVHKNTPPIKRSVHSRIKVIKGDITKSGLGLSARDYKVLSGAITGIMHCAARTDFSISRRDAEMVNVFGTKNVLDFAEHCKKLQKIGIVSTAYVAGKRTGKILESTLTDTGGFVNEYEASKYRMERLARARMGKLPIAIYRLSTVIGDSKTGKVLQSNAVHQALRLYYNGLVPMVPGYSDGRVDLISTNYARDAIDDLFSRNFRKGKTYHVVAGKSSFGLQRFLAKTAALFSAYDKKWNKRGREIPPVVTLKTFDSFKASIEKTDNILLKRIVRAMEYFVPQLSYPKVFDDQNTRHDLRSAIRERSIEEYYPRVIRYCINHLWRGKA